MKQLFFKNYFKKIIIIILFDFFTNYNSVFLKK